MLSINKKQTREEKKYSKILNNLLDIKGRDKTIFSKVNGSDSFDVTTKFGKKISEKMVNQVTFSLTIEEADLENLLKEVKVAKDGKSIIGSYEKFNERLFSTTKLLLEAEQTFKSTKKELVSKLEEKIQKVSSRWKQFRRKVIDTNIQDNIWPLYVATAFVSINTEKRQIYAPLLLRRVRIEVLGSKIKVNSEGSWEINEKIVFLLNSSGFSIDEDISFNDLKINDCLNKLNEQLNSNINTKDLIGKFINIKLKDIKQKTLNFEPGVLLGIFKPSGGHLRKTMMKIIENDEMDEIIDVDPDKSIYRDNLNYYIENNSEDIIRIQPSNYSQDKALLSSLIQDTIIWGPPGTGKSQVIANIIANILNKEKRAVVMSQKKAALDVLKKRLGSISKFCLFILNDNKMKKEEFYKPLHSFVEFVENNIFSSTLKNNKIISHKEIEALNVIRKAKDSKKYNSSLGVISILKNEDDLIHALYNLNHDLSYPEDLLNSRDYLDALALKNNIEKSKFLFFKYYPKHLKYIVRNALHLKANKVDINKTIQHAVKTDAETIKSLLNVTSNLKRDSEQVINEKYLEQKLGKSIISKINSWKQNDKEKLKLYKSFAAAARAKRALPYKFVNKHIFIIKELFPVIITTPETSFVNWEKKSFDYAILDESSQMFLEIGLPILYLAKTKILAGDRKQMQPSRWFATRDDVEGEEDVVENADSLLDYAFDKGIFQQMLDKNYRSSSASLMSFSAKTFYNSNLEVVDNKISSNEKPIEVINVRGKWEKGVNILEAKKVINVVNNNIHHFETIIILTFNSNQKQLIEKMILEGEPKLSSLIEEGNLFIRNIENIQGDEADLIVASIVYDSTTNIASTYVARQGGKNALNVAISRAKDKMIVIKSVSSDKIKSAKSEDFVVFKKWLEFLDMTSEEQKEYSVGEYNIEESYGDTESGFEQEVVEEITSKIKTDKKFKLIKQYPVGSKRIDLAILDSKNKFILGIEVDGYNYHKGWGFDKYLYDLSRQEFLESKGYNIFRIEEIDWTTNREQIFKNLKTLITK